MNLKHLHEFLTLAETGSFARASGRLSVSQSAISKHIMALEAELGVQLFNRKQKAVTLSKFGEELYPYVEKILSERKQFLGKVSKINDIEHKSITIGAIGILALYGLMDTINQFKTEHPDIEVHIQNNEHDLKDMLLSGQVDVAFVREPAKLFFENERIGTIKCISDSIAAVLPAGHPLASSDALDLRLLKDESFYLLDRQLPFCRRCINACNSAGFSPKIVGSGFSGPDIIGYVGRGCGVTLLARTLFDKYFGNDSRVKAVEIKQYMRTYITLIYHRDSENHVINDLFLNYFRVQLSLPKP